MNQKEIEHIIKAIFSKIKKTIRVIQKDFDKEAIHKFRVEIKKLRAFLRLLSVELEEPDDLKLPKSLKEIYSAAGKVRSVQLQLLRMTTSNKKKTEHNHYNKSLDTELISKIDELKNYLNQKSIPGIEKKILTKIPEILEGPDINKFYRLKIENINSIVLLGKFSDSELHHIRKLIKDMVYVSKILNAYSNKLKQHIPLSESSLQLAEKISKELGKFIDICSALPFLKPAYLNELMPPEKKNLETIREKWKSEKEAIKSQLIQLLENFPALETAL